MKRTFICLLVVLAAATAQVAAANLGQTEIVATGTGSVALPPDIATIDAALETNSQNANDAISQNNVTYDRIVGALTKAGVARSDIQLGYYNIRYNPRPSVAPPNPTGERYGYTVVRSFLVKVRQIGKAGTISDTCIAAGATSINSIDFGLSDPAAARSTAIEKAVADARTNAESLARAAGLRLVGIKSIELGARALPEGVRTMLAAPRAAVPTQFDQSNVNVSLTVTVVFVAEP